MSSTTVTAAPQAEPALQILQLTTGGMVAQAVAVAASLGIPDVLNDGPLPVDDIAARVDAHPATLYRLLRALVDLGIVEERPSRVFALAALGQLLRSDVPGSMRGWARYAGAAFNRSAWTDLEHSIRTGDPAFAHVHGTDLFNYLAAHPDDAAVFGSAMQSISRGFLIAVLDSYDTSRYPTVVDVGGGTGALLATILERNPAASGVLLDRPEVLTDAVSVLDSAGVADRCRLVPGDFIDAVPSGGDLYVLSNILHDWDDDEAVRILRTCRQAMADTARLIIIELVLPDDTQPSLAKLVDLEMLAVTPGGRCRTVSEYSDLLHAADLTVLDSSVATVGATASFVEAGPRVGG